MKLAVGDVFERMMPYLATIVNHPELLKNMHDPKQWLANISSAHIFSDNFFDPEDLELMEIWLEGVLEKYPQYAEQSLDRLMQDLSKLEMEKKDMTVLQNHGGGHLNHSFFWTIMAPAKARDEELISRIEKKFGTVDEFKNLFTETAINCFGSGWAWLIENDQKELEVYSTPNQNSPYLNKHTPLIGLDVWEHAYYLKYQNKRAEYVKSWWNVLKLI
jgi:Fe-Mn family superoxide dismutase